jgi:NADP-reducing hydrogenase subunit HndB
MSKRINSLTDFTRLHESLKGKGISEQEGQPDPVIIRIAMATCGIASGAREVERFFNTELQKRSIGARVIPVGCMSYCYAEPTVEVTVPGRDPVVFGYVDVKKADEIIEQYIRNDQTPEGVIPVNYDLA